jgi:hypothetical protein
MTIYVNNASRDLIEKKRDQHLLRALYITLYEENYMLCFCFSFWWDWGLNSGFHACKADFSHTSCQSILLWSFWRWALANYLPGLALNCNPPTSASQVASITGVSHDTKLFA